MTAPKRCRAILEGEIHESWWLTDNLRTFVRWGDGHRASLNELSFVAHGLNDPEVWNAIPKPRKVAWQAPR